MNFLPTSGSDDDCVRTFAQAAASRSLELLKAIEFTLVSVENDTQILDLMQSDIANLHEGLIKADAQTPIDRSGAICVSLERSTDVLSRMYAAASAKHQSACEDFRLTSDDGVADAWTDYLKAARGLHDAIEELREWIETHDAILEPGSGKRYDNVEHLIADLRSN